MFHKEKVKICENSIKDDTVITLEKKVKHLESQLKESEEKRKKSIVDQHEAEYATRKIRSEHERLKIEYNCLNNLMDLQKSNMKTSIQTKISSPEP